MINIFSLFLIVSELQELVPIIEEQKEKGAGPEVEDAVDSAEAARKLVSKTASYAGKVKRRSLCQFTFCLCRSLGPKNPGVT